ncbi:MAG: hypothetical protein IJR67_04775 [Acholeplasmatales bacterium]|jgi:hypothetical protein|nr:hypothetical protein [Acholeplasmatales bacterium]
MDVKNFILKNLLGFEKYTGEKQNPGVIGHYDSKPYHNFRYALIYAGEAEVLVSDEVEIYSRVYKGVTLINVLINDEKNIDSLEQFKFDNIKEKLFNANVQVTDKNIVLVLFQNYNQKTVNLACSFCDSDKKHIEQAIVYNSRLVQMDYYKPVPKFYAIYRQFCEDLFFDLAFLDENEKDK